MVGRAPIAVHSSKENLTQESEQVPSFLVDVVETSPSAHKIYLVWLAVLDKHTCRIPDPIWLRNLHKGSWCSMMFLLIFDNLTGDILSGWQVTKMAHVTWFQVESSAALYHLRNFSESFWENQWAKSSIHTFSRLSLFFSRSISWFHQGYGGELWHVRQDWTAEFWSKWCQFPILQALQLPGEIIVGLIQMYPVVPSGKRLHSELERSTGF